MSNDNTSRYDEFYLKEDHASEPKEYFKKAVSILRPLTEGKTPTFLDIGCAAGDFLRHASSEMPGVRYFGMDLFEPLLETAAKRVPDATFIVGDMNAEGLEIEHGPFDIVTMLGVLSIFSNENWIGNFASRIAPGGTGLIFGMVNPHPYDVFVSLRNQQGEYEYGWNAWSADTLRKRFEGLGFTCDITHWTPPVTIAHSPEAPLRSWTEELADGGRLIVNGSRMVHDFAFVTLKRA